MSENANILTINAGFADDAVNGISGNIDKLDMSGIHGWLYHAANRKTNPEIVFYAGELQIARGVLDAMRNDICALTGSSKECGFSLRLQVFTDDVEKIAPDVEYPLICNYGGQKLLFGNMKSIPGDLLKNYLSANVLKPVLKLPSAMEIKEKFEDVLGKSEPAARIESDVKLIAYYLPQFHPIPENDEWWGYGFTEWTNVAQARPFFKNHYQPHIPGELGFYDLRYCEVREAQADLAREYGIYGFCYYYYWFNGRRLLEKPLNAMLETGRPDFPFCICWANETWSRRWDGSENDILIRQDYSEGYAEQFIQDVIPLFQDPRYIRLNGAPLLMIYRMGELPDAKGAIGTWRKICKENGIPNIHICAVATFGFTEPYSVGCDSCAQFPPHGNIAASITQQMEELSLGFEGEVYRFSEVVRNEIERPLPSQKTFPGVMTSWDNTPRKKNGGHVFLDSTPELYEVWLRAAMEKARKSLPQGERLVFINAWNEWAEGAHLEPDRKYKRAYLEATRRALTRTTSWPELLKYGRKVQELTGEEKENLLSDLEVQLQRLELQKQWYDSLFLDHGMPSEWSAFIAGMPDLSDYGYVSATGLGFIEQINHTADPVLVRTEKRQKMYISGFCLTPGHFLEKSTPTWILLRGANNDVTYSGFVSQRIERSDIAEQYKNINKDHTWFAGFQQVVDIGGVEKGIYSISIMSLFPEGISIIDANTRIEVI